MQIWGSELWMQAMCGHVTGAEIHVAQVTPANCPGEGRQTQQRLLDQTYGASAQRMEREWNNNSAQVLKLSTINPQKQVIR